MMAIDDAASQMQADDVAEGLRDVIDGHEPKVALEALGMVLTDVFVALSRERRAEYLIAFLRTLLN